MHLSLLALTAFVSAVIAAPKNAIEAQKPMLGCDKAAFDGPQSDNRTTSDRGKLATDLAEVMQSVSPAAVTAGKYDFGLIAGTGWAVGDQRKQFIAVVADDNQAMIKYYSSDAGWNDGWQKIGGYFSDHNLAVHQFGDTVYISGVDVRGILVLKYFRNGKFYPSGNSWIFLDNEVEGVPAMANTDDRLLKIAARGSESKTLYCYTFDTITEEQSFVQISTTAGVANPTLVSRTAGTLDVFQYVGGDHFLTQNTFNGKYWSASKTLIGYYGAGSPKAISRDGRIDVVVVGQSKKVFLNTYDGSKWTLDRNAGKDAVISATPLYWKDSVYGYYQDSATVKSVKWTADDTTDPVDMDGLLWSPPVAFTYNRKTRIDLWGVGEGGQVFQKVYDSDDGWGPWTGRGGSALV